MHEKALQGKGLKALPEIDVGEKVVNASHNVLRSLAGVPKSAVEVRAACNSLRSISLGCPCPFLRVLDLSSNCLVSLAGVEELRELRSLNVSHNRIASTRPIAALARLESLDLSHNGLTRLEGFAALIELTALDVSGNALTTLEGVSPCAQLRELVADDNRLQGLQGLRGLRALEALTLAGNAPLSSLDGIDCGSNILDLSVARCAFKSLADIAAVCPSLVLLDARCTALHDDLAAAAQQLAPLTDLRELRLCDDPAKAPEGYAAAVRAALPGLLTLDDESLSESPPQAAAASDATEPMATRGAPRSSEQPLLSFLTDVDAYRTALQETLSGLRAAYGESYEEAKRRVRAEVRGAPVEPPLLTAGLQTLKPPVFDGAVAMPRGPMGSGGAASGRAAGLLQDIRARMVQGKGEGGPLQPSLSRGHSGERLPVPPPPKAGAARPGSEGAVRPKRAPLVSSSAVSRK